MTMTDQQFDRYSRAVAYKGTSMERLVAALYALNLVVTDNNPDAHAARAAAEAAAREWCWACRNVEESRR